jgi:hypothetical protein
MHEQITILQLNLKTNQERAIGSDQIYLNLSPDFQREYEAWDDKLKTRFIETILLGRVTNPIWVVINEDEDTEEVLDGMHRVSTALAFLNNGFELNKKYLMTLDAEKYDKKMFKDLDHADKTKIRNYNFILNKLDASYREEEKLQIMYDILNRSSVPLNDYEFNKITLRQLNSLIAEYKAIFAKTNFFSAKDKRGAIDTSIIEMLVLSYSLPGSWSSVSNLKSEWIKNELGETSSEVSQYIAENGETIKNKLMFMNKMIHDFYQKALFSTDKTVRRNLFMIYKFIVCRCCNLINGYPFFNRLSNDLIKRFKSELLVDDIMTKFDCTSRNASFQKKVITHIDIIIKEVLENDTDNSRRFSKKVIQDKLLEQNNLCTWCNQAIKDGDDIHGHHIISWRAGGKTVPENLQVLHNKCHEELHSRG